MILLLLLVAQPHDLEDMYNAATTLLVQFQDEQKSAFNSLIDLGLDPEYADTALSFLVEKFDTKSAIERHRLKDMFKEMGVNTIPSIVNRIDYRGSDAEDRHLKQSLWVLGEIGGDEVVAPVGQFIQDSSWQIRSAAYTALGKSESENAHEYIIEGLCDPIAEVRKSAYYALSRIAKEQDITYFIRGLDDAFYGVRYAAIQGLVALDSLAIEPLRVYASGKNGSWFFAVHGLAELKALDEAMVARFLSCGPEIRLLIYEACNDVTMLESYLEHEDRGMLRTFLYRKLNALYDEMKRSV